MELNDIQQHSSLGKIGLFEILTIFKDGIKIGLSKECRLFIIVPIIINFIVLSFGAFFAYRAITGYLDSLVAMLPDWAQFVSYILAFMVFLSISLAFCFVFSLAASIIASPFYSFLAEKVELKLYGTKGNDDGVADIIKDVPRIIKRELRKQLFYLPRAALCLILLFIPVVNILFTPVWFLLSSYMAALQFSDYAFDNHKVNFPLMRKALGSSVPTTFLFGMAVAFLLTIPILNLIIPPCAVCAGTIYYVRLRQVNPDLPLKRTY